MEGDGGRLIQLATQLKIISIHSLRMEGDVCRNRNQRLPAISIHSLRMEGDSEILI